MSSCSSQCSCAEAATEKSPAGGESQTVASVNGVPIQLPGEPFDAEMLRQRAYTELLRQAAQQAGLLSREDVPSPDGILSEAATEAIEALLEKNVVVPEPSEEACRRHHAAHSAQYRQGERANVRHILFAVTEGVDVVALRKRAEHALIDVRSHAPDETGSFAETARTLSNCPSGQDGGALGWLSAGDCAPEFAKEIFGHTEVGVLPRLVHSRFGLHVVEVLERDPGEDQPFEAVRGAVVLALQQQAYITALRQYLSLLAGQARIEGVELEAAETPLVQ